MRLICRVIRVSIEESWWGETFDHCVDSLSIITVVQIYEEIQ